MSNALLSSKVVILEEEPRIRSIDAVQTSIVAAVGITERGPLATPTLVTSDSEFQTTFGGHTANADLPHSVAGFFENSGQFLYIIRTVHYTDPATPGTATATAATITIDTAATGPTAGSVTGSLAEPFAFSPGDTLVIDVDGGGDVTATFDAAAAAITSGNTETFALTNGMDLTLAVDGGSVQTVAFLTAEFASIGAATALEVAAVINAKATGLQATVAAGAVVITSDVQGTDSNIEISGGTANAILGFSTTPVAGTGDVADIAAVTAAEIKTVVEADVAGLTISSVLGAIKIESNTTGLSSSIAVNATSTADTKIGVDNATHTGGTGAAVPTLQLDARWVGAYGNDISFQVVNATSGEAAEFDLLVVEDGIIVENYQNLSMLDGSSSYVEDVVNTSQRVQATDLDAVVDQRPANVITTTMAGGDDGLTGLTDTDFIGSSVGGTGIRALDTIQDVNILIIPGQATSAIQNAMITYCEDTRDGSMFAIMDPPEGLSATQIITYFETTSSLLGLSEFGAAYWPRIEVLNPNEAVFGAVATLTVAPSGHIAGVYARTDNARPGGIYDPPAGIEKGILRGVQGFETDEVLDEAKRDLVYPKRINILTTFPGAPLHIDGSRCLKGNGNFPFVPQRRGAIFIEQSVKNGTQFARHQNNTAKLRRSVEGTIRQFLLLQMRNEAFASQDPNTAFFVDFSDKLNPESEVRAGKMNGRVGLAFNTPAEFIVIRFSRDTRALEQELAG